MKKVKLNKKGFKSGQRLDIDLLENVPEGLDEETRDRFLQDVWQAVDKIAKKYPKLHVIDIGWDLNGTGWYDKELLTKEYFFK